ncbi:MAG: hypothetical protein HZB39_11610 [Planctomycetes bacterium]|nr:hypothetical protein [Planctomycetota bacterium]
MHHRNHLAVSFVASLALAAASSAQNSTTYDLAADWSDAGNPHSPWSYDGGAAPIAGHVPNWSAGGFAIPQPAWALTPAGNGHCPMWMLQVGTWTLDSVPGDVVMHGDDPSCGNGGTPANVKWTAPCGGNATVSSAVWMLRNLGRSMNWTLKHNGNVLAQGAMAGGGPYSRANPATYGSTFAVLAGDVIELGFVKTSFFGDFAGVRLQISVDQWCGRSRFAGAGCGPTQWNNGVPRVGASSGFAFAGAQANAPGVALIGLLPAVVDLSGIGMTNCVLRTSPMLGSLPAQADGAGRGSVSLGLPADPSLAGAGFETQFATLAIGVNPLGVVVSDAMSHQIGI